MSKVMDFYPLQNSMGKKHGQEVVSIDKSKFLNTIKKSVRDALNTVLKTAVQKTLEKTDDVVQNKKTEKKYKCRSKKILTKTQKYQHITGTKKHFDGNIHTTRKIGRNY